MLVNNLAKTLHPLERKVLPVLKQGISLKEIVQKTKLKEVEVTRALQWLENKGILKIKHELKEIVNLGKNGEHYLRAGLPERRFIKALNKEAYLDEIKIDAGLNDEELSVCLGLLKKKSAIEIEGGMVRLTEQGKQLLKKDFLVEHFIKKLPLNLAELKAEDKLAYEELKKRKEIIKTGIERTRTVELTNLGSKLIKVKVAQDLIDTLTPRILKEGNWKEHEFRGYDVKINVPKIYPGKRHFVNQAIAYAKKIWLEMGFKEMTGPIVQTSFWNFDALFTAQDHPVRDIQDTFYLKDPAKGKLPDKVLIAKVKKAHEEGVCGSTGWKYNWNIEEAKRNVLRTHTTVLSARTLAVLKKSEWPAKFFAVGKCFRNETMDWSHLFEFNQTEGIVVDPNANFRHLLGYLKEFFAKMGFQKARFRPFFFPYTEPSLEIEVFHPERKQWLELGGAGILRPEVVEPLLGENVPVLAWGPGLDRMLMDYYKINDVRMLYKNDIKQLKEARIWLCQQ